LLSLSFQSQAKIIIHEEIQTVIGFELLGVLSRFLEGFSKNQGFC